MLTFSFFRASSGALKQSGDEFQRDWSELPQDILNLIWRQLDPTDDLLSFVRVCKSWRSSAGIPFAPPWLMFKNNCSFRFSGLKKLTDNFCDIPIPLSLERIRCVGSKGVWVVVVDSDLNIRILNPFTYVEYNLPSFSYVFNLSWFRMLGWCNQRKQNLVISKVVLSCSPRSNACVAAAISVSSIFMARPGAQTWNPLLSCEGRVHDIAFLDGRLFAISEFGFIYSYNVDGAYPLRCMLKIKIQSRPDRFYLVQWLGKLLLVIRYRIPGTYGNGRNYRNVSWKVYKLRFGYGSLCKRGFFFGRLYISMQKRVKSLRGHALFLGSNTSVAVLASESSTFRPNCIYFTDDHHMQYCEEHRTADFIAGTLAGTRGDCDVGVFDMKKKEVIQHFTHSMVRNSPFCPPLWIV